MVKNKDKYIVNVNFNNYIGHIFEKNTKYFNIIVLTPSGSEAL